MARAREMGVSAPHHSLWDWFWVYVFSFIECHISYQGIRCLYFCVFAINPHPQPPTHHNHYHHQDDSSRDE